MSERMRHRGGDIRGPMESIFALTGSAMSVHEALLLMYVDVNLALSLPCKSFEPQSPQVASAEHHLSLARFHY